MHVVGFGNLEEALPPDFAHLPVGISLGVAHPVVCRMTAQPGGWVAQ